MKDHIDANSARKCWMSLLSKAPSGRPAALLDGVMERPAFSWLRPPEVGAVMVRGRAGGTGAPFNVGEMSVTRACLQLADGPVGHSYIQGRNKGDAEVAALIDALMQTEAAPEIKEHVLDRLEAEARAKRNHRAAKAAATKVEFFTLARGED